jgi:TolA-binding protein
MSEHTINTTGREASFATIAGEQNVQRIAIERMQKQLEDLTKKIDRLTDAIHIGNGQPPLTGRLTRLEQRVADLHPADKPEPARDSNRPLVVMGTVAVALSVAITKLVEALT